ncbi:MAG: hypothetical protein PHU29_09305 [Sulfuricurvum sp.]|uniref:hypothetical protein n=1 Tax=Sulfuricurvum sp. TaxID=2025608 RepID=UPI002639F144|nr:hypothetical protein [Sulfuricurvum sp.]MDD2950972.1 hypothetical protein [Sulfuricurvum sp.]MDD5117359.1 hypothetical protein [Sulfuricurvum sp.]
MSSLSEQERIGLEEVFLSISSSQNFMKKWSIWGKTLSERFDAKKFASPLLLTHNSRRWLKISLKNHKITKLFNKMQKRRKI